MRRALNRDRQTDEVFHVGKGYGNRAWDTTSRNDSWNQKVASLNAGWYVQVAREDLSEIEAFEIESELVDQYGGADSGGGRLTNWLPGGENPVAYTLGVEVDLGEREGRAFKQLPRPKQEAFATKLHQELTGVSAQVDALGEQADERGDEALEDSVYNLDTVLGSFLAVSSDFQKRRVSWQQYASSLADTVDDLAGEVADLAEYYHEVQPLLHTATQTARDAFSRIDSEN